MSRMRRSLYASFTSSSRAPLPLSLTTVESLPQRLEVVRFEVIPRKGTVIVCCQRFGDRSEFVSLQLGEEEVVAEEVSGAFVSLLRQLCSDGLLSSCTFKFALSKHLVNHQS